MVDQERTAAAAQLPHHSPSLRTRLRSRTAQTAMEKPAQTKSGIRTRPTVTPMVKATLLVSDMDLLVLLCATKTLRAHRSHLHWMARLVVALDLGASAVVEPGRRLVVWAARRRRCRRCRLLRRCRGRQRRSSVVWCHGRRYLPRFHRRAVRALVRDRVAVARRRLLVLVVACRRSALRRRRFRRRPRCRRRRRPRAGLVVSGRRRRLRCSRCRTHRPPLPVPAAQVVAGRVFRWRVEWWPPRLFRRRLRWVLRLRRRRGCLRARWPVVLALLVLPRLRARG